MLCCLTERKSCFVSTVPPSFPSKAVLSANSALPHPSPSLETVKQVGQLQTGPLPPPLPKMCD